MTETKMREISEKIVFALVGEDLAPKWWTSSNLAFSGKTPDEQWTERPRAVYEYLMFHAYSAGC